MLVLTESLIWGKGPWETNALLNAPWSTTNFAKAHWGKTFKTKYESVSIQTPWDSNNQMHSHALYHNLIQNGWKFFFWRRRCRHSPQRCFQGEFFFSGDTQHSQLNITWWEWVSSFEILSSNSNSVKHKRVLALERNFDEFRSLCQQERQSHSSDWLLNRIWIQKKRSNCLELPVFCGATRRFCPVRTGFQRKKSQKQCQLLVVQEALFPSLPLRQ